MPFFERCRRTREWANLKVAYLLPRRLKYWVVIHEINRIIPPDQIVPDYTLDEILKALDYEKSNDAQSS